MRRIHIFAGLAACALLLFASMSATVAAPVRAPMLQTNESEPNDSTAQADPVDVGTSITGQLEMFTDVDYFSLTTDIDRE